MALLRLGNRILNENFIVSVEKLPGGVAVETVNLLPTQHEEGIGRRTMTPGHHFIRNEDGADAVWAYFQESAKLIALPAASPPPLAE